MRTLQFGDKGEDVRTLQRILQEQGFFHWYIGGNFLKRTKQAVIYFQETHLGPNGEFLETDGIVGDNTWWALENPSGEAQRSYIPGRIPDDLTPLRYRQLEIALTEHRNGVQEIPDGSNWSDEISKYGVYYNPQKQIGQPWCCYFWSWCNKECFGYYSLTNVRYRGHCKTTWEKALEQGMAFYKEEYNPLPGDAFIMLYRENGRFKGTGHIGFVLRVEVSNGQAVAINTVEGNAGNRVKVGKRNLSSTDIIGFINNFPADEQPEDWEMGLVQAGLSDSDSTR